MYLESEKLLQFVVNSIILEIPFPNTSMVLWDSLFGYLSQFTHDSGIV